MDRAAHLDNAAVQSGHRRLAVRPTQICKGRHSENS